MSFCTDAKEELARIPTGRACCDFAEIGALTATTGSLGFVGGGRMAVTYRTQNGGVARRILRMLKAQGLSPTLETIRSSRLGGRTAYVLVVGPNDAPTLLTHLGMMSEGEEGPTLTRFTPRMHITKRCCRRAYLRGAFLGAGSLAAPEREYRFEWLTDDEQETQTILRLCEKEGLQPKLGQRRGLTVVALRDAEQVSAVLAAIGAPQAMLKLESARVTHGAMEQANRAANCDVHNARRMVSAASEQLAAIRALAARQDLSALPFALREAASARLEHPDLSLEELGALLRPPVGKSGMANRMRRLIALSKQPPAEG